MMNIGTKLEGFCNGCFGRDDYEDKIIIFEGLKWIVCKYVDTDAIVCLNFNSVEEKNKAIALWSTGTEFEVDGDF